MSEGDLVARRGASMWFTLLSSCSKMLDHFSGSTFLMFSLMGSRLGIS